MFTDESLLELVLDLVRLQVVIDQMGHDVAAAHLAAAIDSLQMLVSDQTGGEGPL